MTLRLEFPLRARVQLAPAAVAEFPDYEGHGATVVGYSRNGHSVRVMWDNRRMPSNWHRRFIEVVHGELTHGGKE
jgi:hypothetical protein